MKIKSKFQKIQSMNRLMQQEIVNTLIDIEKLQDFEESDNVQEGQEFKETDTKETEAKTVGVKDSQSENSTKVEIRDGILIINGGIRDGKETPTQP